MSDERDTLTCSRHGEGAATYICQHLAKKPAQKWFSEEPSEEDPWPDAWCAECDIEFQKTGEWNGDNEDCLGGVVICDQCYEMARLLGRVSSDTID